mmetsp:Transcript_7284/g.16514  ORF Transcript_7284/g.16514 Transcript_7284/m.16514 type:complete len:562 (+) Transcript_7284:325-2010(+)
MRRSSVFEGSQQETKLRLRFFLGQAQYREDLLLQVPPVNSDRSTTNFHTIDDHVVGIGPDVLQGWVLSFQFDHLIDVLFPGRSEWVVLRHESVLILVPLEHGEVDDPESFEAFRSQAQLCAHDVAELAHALLSLQSRPSEDAEQITWLAAAWLRIGLLDPSLVLFFGEELFGGRVEGAILIVLHPDQGACTNLLASCLLLQLLNLLARPLTQPFAAHCNHEFSLVKNLEVTTLCNIGDLHELHVISKVGLIDAETVHGFAVFHALEGRELVLHDFLENFPNQTLEGLQDVFLRNKRHFAIDLCKLGLAIRPKLLVTEAFDDLKVSVHTANHQQLLEGLRRLGQRIELASVHSGRHNEISGTLWSRLDQDRSLDFTELQVSEVVTNDTGHFVSEHEGVFDWVSSNVQISVPHSGFFLAIGGVFNLERRSHASVQNFQTARYNLHISSWSIWVLVDSLDYLALDLDHELSPQLVGCFVALEAFLVGTIFLENHLGDAISVSQIDEGEMVHVAGNLYPTAQSYSLADIRHAQLPTRMSPIGCPDAGHGRLKSPAKTKRDADSDG